MYVDDRGRGEENVSIGGDVITASECFDLHHRRETVMHYEILREIFKKKSSNSKIENENLDFRLII